MERSYIVNVPWVKDGFELHVVKLEETITPTTRDTTLEFDYAGHRYKYQWSSSPQQGLGWLYKDDKMVYSPYEYSGQDSTMYECGRLLLSEIKNAK